MQEEVSVDLKPLKKDTVIKEFKTEEIIIDETINEDCVKEELVKSDIKTETDIVASMREEGVSTKSGLLLISTLRFYETKQVRVMDGELAELGDDVGVKEGGMDEVAVKEGGLEEVGRWVEGKRGGTWWRRVEGGAWLVSHAKIGGRWRENIFLRRNTSMSVS